MPPGRWSHALGRLGRPRRADLRDAGRAHAGAGPARAPQRSGRPATSRCSTSCCGRCSARASRPASASSATSAPPTRPARRAASPRWPASSGLRAPRIAVVKATTSATRRTAPLLQARARTGDRRAADRQRERLPRRRGDRRRADRRRRHRRLRPRRRSVADGRSRAGPLRLGARRLGPAGARDDGRPPARMRRPGHAAATTPTPASRTCRAWRGSATRSPRSTPTATA